MADIAFSVLDLALSTGKYLFDLKELYKGLPDELEKLRVLIYQVHEFLSRGDAQEKAGFREHLLNCLQKSRDTLDSFVKDCKEHKVKNFLGSVFGKGAKEKLEEIANITKEINDLLSKFNIEINQLSLEKLSQLADSENKKYNALVILQHPTAKQFWQSHVGKEKSEFPSWESFMNAVRSELTAEEMTDLRAKLSILEGAIRLKIAGTDGLVDVYEFNALTAKYGWPQGLFVTVTEIEESYHNVPPGVKDLFSRLEKLGLLKMNDYRDAFINFGVTWEKLSDFNEQYLMRFLVEDIKMNTLDASKVVKAAKATDSNAPPSPVVSTASVSVERKELEKSAEVLLRDTARWKLNLNEIKLERTVGSGTFSEVYVGTWRGCKVAVKQLKIKESSNKSISKDDIVHEATVISHIPGHSHIIRYFGAAFRPPVMCIVTEFCEKGTLREFLSDDKNTLNWSTALKIIKGAAYGLSHIHSEGFIHGDIAARNVLLTANFNACIADFGLARKGNQEDPNLAIQLPNILIDRRWAAPEVLEKRTLSVKSDVYSFGIVLWEVFTRRIPYDFTQDINYISDLIMGEKTPVMPKESKPAPQGLRKLINKCWCFNVLDRATMHDVVREIEVMQVPSGDPDIVKETDTPQKEKRTGGGYDDISESIQDGDIFDELIEEEAKSNTPEDIVLKMLKEKYLLPKEEVTKAIQRTKGSFIIRWSQKEKCYVLSVNPGTTVKNFRLESSGEVITVQALKITNASPKDFLLQLSKQISVDAVPYGEVDALAQGLTSSAQTE